MGECIGHLKEAKWTDFKSWCCVCCCPNYVACKLGVEILQKDAYQAMCCAYNCPCFSTWAYFKFVSKLSESVVNKILGCLWVNCCPLCALYVAVTENGGIDPVQEIKDGLELTKKVVCISRG